MTITRITRLAGIAVVGFGLLGTASPSRAQDRPTAEQIEVLRKQVEELKAQLDRLEKGGASAESTEGEAGTAIPEGWIENLSWRSIGPANMGGRITALAVVEDVPSHYWVATASGGLLKTVNNGVTFEHQFDGETTVSIGDVAVAPSDPSILWVGTGEENPRNSASYGDGVYKSTDGGKSWKRMGLEKTYQIGGIAIHPEDPNIVYVGALGRLWGPNEERGLYKTTDGGENWEKILYIDEKTGVMDVQMSPDDPDTLLVATYQRKRDIYDTNDPEVKWGPGSGIHKTTDGGKTWKKITEGLPTSDLGRIGIDYYRKDPKIVYALVESESIGTGPPSASASSNVYVGVIGGPAEDEAKLEEVVEGGPAAASGLKGGDIVTEFDGKPIKTYPDFIDALRDRKPGDKLKVKATRAGEVVEVELTLGERPAQRSRGGDPKKPFLDSLGGQRENVQGRQGDDAFEHGGLYRSADGGDTWERINSINPRPMYFSQVRVDPSDENYIYVLGVSLYRSKDRGKTFKADGGRGVHADQHALWVDPNDGGHMLLGCDGGLYTTYDRMENWDHLNHAAIAQFYHVALDTRPFYNVYGGLQDNGTWGGPSRTKDRTGAINEDWLSIGGGDGFKCQVDPSDPNLIYFTSQNGGIGRRDLATGEVSFFRPRAGDDDPEIRFNWNTPFVLSHANPKIYYVAGNYVFRSLDRGEDLRKISPDLASTDKGTATAFSESPKDPDVLYVGTDDGNLWVTKDGGRDWAEIHEKVGLPKSMFIASIEASRAEAGRVYVAFDGHRSDLDDPFVYVSQDYGQTWESLDEGLPRGSTRCLREDIENPEVLYLGTEFGAYTSIDRGRSWTSLNTNLPTVAVYDLAQHPTTGEVVAATHGRSLWIADIEPIRQLSEDVLKSDAFLFDPLPVQRWHADPSRGRTNRRFAGENPPLGLPIYYHLGTKAEKATIKVYDIEGNAIRSLNGSVQPGLQRVIWDLTKIAPRPPRERPESESGEESEGESGEAQEREAPPQNNRAFGRPQAAPPGSYKIVLTVDDEDYTRVVIVEPDPDGPDSGIAAGFFSDEGEDEEEREIRESREGIDD